MTGFNRRPPGQAQATLELPQRTNPATNKKKTSNPSNDKKKKEKRKPSEPLYSRIVASTPLPAGQGYLSA